MITRKYSYILSDLKARISALEELKDRKNPETTSLVDNSSKLSGRGIRL